MPRSIPKFPKVLALDTSGPFCAIGTATESYSAGVVHEMARGQAEALFPLAEARLKEIGWSMQDLDALGVSVGPGNFTGIRIGVSAAKGLALSLGIPVYGVSNFELAALSQHLGLDRITISLPAPRDQAYVQSFIAGAPAGPPALIDPDTPPADLLPSGVHSIFGHRASTIAKRFSLSGEDEGFSPAPAQLAERTEELFLAASGAPDDSASPLYIRPADAAPPKDAGPVIVS
ncbi:tRNA (adenosine(37)-N6)-threonylcarbamoyltransferase complex dimerization subunit type 1 TsaB [Ovoidimarina sediminis]|uniref:tRNA (adenosine(37)-N6)-threonylcarbamoyltransferase complex dimerization subunit type 1 TsaB n=1 Tax=Ovoidimarina sediminis TaxID=3079856 RepID=UPI0029076C1B|nr:tRNA (adenosine(37)-N6)-threonylcarbamoyltransferase complex dimerization subunit type 1 TsaB [Rhodophyticola sp. MJ-SS7]MDU8944569.1 tRNA (adenosine(37)-N6)-threonylcarbamoyltransferase complex dimerization subunit type 1 TsaB [Rhodophyticola sp. MJ-SS7]